MLRFWFSVFHDRVTEYFYSGVLSCHVVTGITSKISLYTLYLHNNEYFVSL